MFGSATLSIPADGAIGLSHTEGLSDELARTIGRIAARTLPDYKEFVTVTLESGRVVTIGPNDPVDMDVVRECGGFREYANDVVRGYIL